MALNIYDTASGTTVPVAQGQQQPFSIANLLQDRNFLSLLAGIGTGLDPKGIGGALGAPTQAVIASQAAQERAAKQAAAQNEQTKMVIQALSQYGGVTPKGAPGIDSIESTKDGAVKIQTTPQGGGGDYSGSGLETPIAPAPPVPGRVSPNIGSQSRREAATALLPFYSNLLDPLRAPWLGSVLNK
jgi:hypothetical protein